MAALELNTEAFLRICTPDPVTLMLLIMIIVEGKMRMATLDMVTVIMCR